MTPEITFRLYAPRQAAEAVRFSSGRIAAYHRVSDQFGQGELWRVYAAEEHLPLGQPDTRQFPLGLGTIEESRVAGVRTAYFRGDINTLFRAMRDLYYYPFYEEWRSADELAADGNVVLTNLGMLTFEIRFPAFLYAEWLERIPLIHWQSVVDTLRVEVDFNPDPVDIVLIRIQSSQKQALLDALQAIATEGTDLED